MNLNHLPFILLIGILLLLTYSCNQNSTNMENSDRQAKIEQNKELARKWILDGWNNDRNAEIVHEIFAQDWIDGNPSFADQPKGIDGAMHFVNVYRSIFPDIHFTLTHLIAEEDIVCFRFTAEATHKGKFMEIEPTGKRVNISGIVIHRVKNGRFAESWNEIDLLGLRSQLLSDS